MIKQAIQNSSSVKRLLAVWRSNKLQFWGSGMLVVLSFLLLGWLVYRQREYLVTYSWKINGWYLLLSFVLYGITQLVVTLIWSRILSCFGSTVGFYDHLRYYCLSGLAKRLPGTVWYVVWRAQLYQREGITATEASLASGIEVAVSVISGAITVIVFSAYLLAQYQLGLISIILLLVFSLVLLHPRIIQKIVRYFAKRDVQFRYLELIFWVFLYALAWILGGGIQFAFIQSIYQVPLSQLGFVIGSWTLVGVLSTVLFFLPTNFGFNQLGISLLLSNIMPTPMAVVISVFTRIILTIYEVAWAFAAYLLNFRGRKAD